MSDRKNAEGRSLVPTVSSTSILSRRIAGNGTSMAENLSMEIYHQQYFRAYADGTSDVEFVGVFKHVGQAHTCAEAEVAYLFRSGTEPGLHCLIYVGNTFARVHKSNLDAVHVDVGDCFAAVCMDNHVDFTLVHRNGNAAYVVGVDTHAFEAKLHLFGGLTCGNKVVAVYVILEVNALIHSKYRNSVLPRTAFRMR